MLAEGSRLDDLCNIRTVDELARRIGGGARFRDAAALQRHLTLEFVAELDMLAASLTGAGAALLDWQRARIQIENLKVLARGLSRGLTPQALAPRLMPFSPGQEPQAEVLDGTAAALRGGDTAARLEALARMVPEGPLRSGVRKVGEAPPYGHHLLFMFDTALDSAYLETLRQRTARLPAADRAGASRLAAAEIDTFNVMLATRGRYHHQMAAEAFRAFLVAGGGVGLQALEQCLHLPDAAAAVSALAGRLGETLEAVAGAPALESLCWHRHLRVANALFRQSHMGLGAVLGYVTLRRIELANLVTFSEGLRMGCDPRQIRARLLPRTAALESQNV